MVNRSLVARERIAPEQKRKATGARVMSARSAFELSFLSFWHWECAFLFWETLHLPHGASRAAPGCGAVMSQRAAQIGFGTLQERVGLPPAIFYHLVINER